MKGYIDVTRFTDIENAFRKLQEYVYFDTTDLHVRGQLVEFINKGGVEGLRELLFKLSDIDKNFKEYLDKIEIRYFPKKVTEKLKKPLDKVPSNFISNAFAKEGCEISRVSIFCDMPIELHVMAVLWVMDYGYILDRKLKSNSLGNRILFQQGKIARGRTLFKPYFKQYQKWWSNGIKKADELLKEGENVTILNFDLKDYFHRAEIDFDEMETVLSRKKPEIAGEPLHLLFRRIHEVYSRKLQAMGNPEFGTTKKNKFPLPVGVLSSFVLANWHLKKLDDFVVKKLIPSYYSRYVDDIFIVLKERIVDKFGSKQKRQLVSYFQSIGVKIKVTDDQINPLTYFVSKYLKELLLPTITKQKKEDKLIYNIKLKGLTNLELQEEKIFIYQFDAKLSPHLISKFVEEQKERSSEFRFLSDQEDEGFEDFEDATFESNFETADVNKAKFKIIEDNKFKLSVYFAKLIQRRIERGSGYKDAEIDKIEKYFKGIYLIKNYFFWEKLFTLYVIAEKKGHLFRLIKAINSQIKILKVSCKGIKVDVVRKNLSSHLQNSLSMALGINPGFANLSAHEYFGKASISIDVDPNYFRKVGLLRKQFIYYPLIQFSAKALNENFSLADSNIFDSHVWNQEDFSIDSQSFLPYRVKFYECALYTYREILNTQVKGVDPNGKRWETDLLATQQVLNQSFDLFYNINNPQLKGKEQDVRNEYFQPNNISVIDDAFEVRPQNLFLNEMYFKNSGKSKGDYRVGLVNQYVDFKNYENSLEGRPSISGRIETFSWLLDQISEIKNLDLFVMPELSLPHSLLKKFVHFSARKQIAFVSGVEHLKVDNVGFNFIMSCLPINIGGDKDAIPILRLKNHYAPDEEEWIQGKHMVVPKPKPYRYDLFEWRGLYFSSYYCYELADIYHRAAFASMVDLICAPVWNMDTHYYSNIVESATRDMHCYFIQVNTSQYGDTRVTRPTDHVRKDKAKVQGGTVDGHEITLLVSDIDVKKLRDFQVVTFPAQKILNANKKSFKPTPPDFQFKNTRTRMNEERFGVYVPYKK